jgi:hypothetical protein
LSRLFFRGWRVPGILAGCPRLEMQGSRAKAFYKALSGERSPDFDTVLRVMAALGLRLHAEAAQG